MHGWMMAARPPLWERGASTGSRRTGGINEEKKKKNRGKIPAGTRAARQHVWHVQSARRVSNGVANCWAYPKSTLARPEATIGVVERLDAQRARVVVLHRKTTQPTQQASGTPNVTSTATARPQEKLKTVLKTTKQTRARAWWDRPLRRVASREKRTMLPCP